MCGPITTSDNFLIASVFNTIVSVIPDGHEPLITKLSPEVRVISVLVRSQSLLGGAHTTRKVKFQPLGRLGAKAAKFGNDNWRMMGAKEGSALLLVIHIQGVRSI